MCSCGVDKLLRGISRQMGPVEFVIFARCEWEDVTGSQETDHEMVTRSRKNSLLQWRTQRRGQGAL